MKILHTSWGYDMTLNEYCKVIKETPHKVKCVMIGTSVENDDGRGNGAARPDATKETSAPFYLVKKDGYYVGSYPFCNGSTRRDTFREVSANAVHYHNTWN